jgi:hypothetical protein
MHSVKYIRWTIIITAHTHACARTAVQRMSSMEPETDGGASVLGARHRQAAGAISIAVIPHTVWHAATVSDKKLHHRRKANAIVAIRLNNANTHVLRSGSLAPEVTVTRATHVKTSRQSEQKT